MAELSDEELDAQTRTEMDQEEYRVVVKVTREYEFTVYGNFDTVQNNYAREWANQPGINRFGGPELVSENSVELVTWDRRR